jgi:hypothetical protein
MIWREGPPPHLLCETFGPGQQHAIFTRLGGVSAAPYDTLNQSSMVGDDPACVDENQRRAKAVLNCGREQVVNCQQAHGNRVALVTAHDAGRVIAATDGLVTAEPGLALTMRYADCVPVLFYSAARRAVGIAHAGWRGTAQRVAAATAQMMVTSLGCDPAEIVAAIGPSIGPCCYQVGPEVVAQFQQSFPGERVLSPPDADGRAQADLWRANVAQLREVGVTQVEVSGYCTCCRQDLFYSHRGSGGRTGRFAAFIRLAEVS